MANKRIAFPISEETWTPEGVVSAYPSMPNRPVASYRIGMRENGDQKYFINEPIFVDVYHRILKKEVKCYVNLYQYPYLVCVKDGRLVPHNMAFFELLSAVDTAMEDILIHNKIRAFTEIRRNLYAKERIGETTRILREQLAAMLPEGLIDKGVPLSYAFLRFYLQSHMPLEQTSELEEQLRFMDKAGLSSLQGGLYEYEEARSIHFEPLKNLSQTYAIEDIKAAFQKELCRRFFVGDIH